ncbi:uncharacterized protein [Battus philenor]|uniref:uncharacterized protein n=1 Tax=Battus philenor TaxID=42288 RepID=UPI0035CF72E7
MPALWQASQRPMYVRTVWIDGFRHAILNHDDPHYIELNAKRRRPRSSASITPKRKAQSSRLSHHSDSDCLRNLDLIIKSNKIRFTEEVIIDTLNLSEVEEDEIILRNSPVPISETDNSESQFETLDMRVVKSNRTARTDVRQNNELSDRVLQWLDLAGKVDLLNTETAERISKPRHSCPEIQRRNLNQSQIVNNAKVKENRATIESKANEAIDQQELRVPTSATTIENYARQSRNVKPTSRESHAKVKENKKVKDMRHNIAETRQKMINERKAVEKQYTEMVNKKIIPDLGKTRKQVHIFMPEAIPKVTNSKNGSVLSQKS